MTTVRSQRGPQAVCHGLPVKVCTILQDAGKQCHVVGGAVRDVLMGQEPKDVDFATDATPEEMTRIFEAAKCRVYPTGIQHGTVTVGCGVSPHVEVTTYRTEGTYTDGRRPDSVQFITRLEDDLARRDLTINAMAVEPIQCRLIDPYGGRDDIERGLIRAVGDPKERFTEDGLRPLRAARFAARYGFRIEPRTKAAMRDPEVHRTFRKVALERVRDELLKGINTEHPRDFIEALDDTGYMEAILPELTAGKGLPQPKAHHIYDVWNHSLSAMEHAPKSPFSRWVALMHDVGKPISFNGNVDEPHFYGHDDVGAKAIVPIMERLHFPRADIDKASKLIKNHLIFYNPDWSDSAVRKWVARVGPDLVQDQITLARADLAGHGPQKLEEAGPWYDDLERRLISLDAPKVAQMKLAINGHDLMQLGIEPGREMGRVLSALKERVLEDPQLNSRDTLIDLAQQV